MLKAVSLVPRSAFLLPMICGIKQAHSLSSQEAMMTKRYRSILFIPFLLIGGCSSGEDTATPEQSSKEHVFGIASAEGASYLGSRRITRFEMVRIG